MSSPSVKVRSWIPPTGWASLTSIVGMSGCPELDRPTPSSSSDSPEPEFEPDGSEAAVVVGVVVG